MRDGCGATAQDVAVLGPDAMAHKETDYVPTIATTTLDSTLPTYHSDGCDIMGQWNSGVYSYFPNVERVWRTQPTSHLGAPAQCARTETAQVGLVRGAWLVARLGTPPAGVAEVSKKSYLIIRL